MFRVAAVFLCRYLEVSGLEVYSIEFRVFSTSWEDCPLELDFGVPYFTTFFLKEPL